MIGNFHFPTESLTTKNVIFEKFRKMIKFGVSLVYNFKNPSVSVNKVSTNTCVKIDLIQKKKLWGIKYINKILILINQKSKILQV